jgi:hypothetical protein
MKKVSELGAADLSALLEKSGLTTEEAAPAQPQIARWKDGTPRDAEAAFDWPRFHEDQTFFEKARADGSYQLALDARNTRLAKEAAETARVERDRAIEEKLKELDERDRERQRLEDEAEDRRLQGIAKPWTPR